MFGEDLQYGDCNLFFGHFCHYNRMMLRQWESEYVHPVLFPLQASKKISPCNNLVCASLKARLRKMDPSTPEAKEAAFHQICSEYDPETVQHYFSHCGWTF
jgi:hypothetical protein